MKQLNYYKGALGTLFLLSFCFLFSPTLYAQTQIKGKVTDSSTGQPIVGVTVVESGVNNNGVVTSKDGSYSIKVKNGESSLVFHCLGYSDKTIKVGTKTTINVALAQNAEDIADVVVVGYGTQKKVTLTGAIDNITSKDIENRSVPNALGVLQGKLPGVTVIKKSSQPGSPEISIRIRGEGTLGNNEPLILIDGVPGDIQSINPEDIENVTVLKDAATAAIYGVRASGGVLLFTTKKGRKNQPVKVTASGYYGMQMTTRDPEFVGSVDYMIMRNEARQNMGMQRLYSEDDIMSVRNGTADPTKFAQTDWVGEIYKSFAPIQNYTTSIQGGGENSTYYVSYGYLDHQGIAISDKYKQQKHNIRANISADIIKNILTLEGNMSYDLGDNMTPAGGNGPIYNALKMSVLSPIYNKQGNYMKSIGGNPIADITEGGYGRYKWNNAVMTANARVNITKGISAKVIYSAYRATGVGKTVAKKFKYYDADNKFVVTNREDATISQHTDQNGSDDLTLQGDFNRTFGHHTVTGVVGMTQNNGKWEQYSASKDRYATSQLEILNAGQYNPIVGGTANHYALRSWFARVAESYKDKYYIEALIRQDMTSRFAKNNRRGTFYAFSGSWRLMEESFMQSIKKSDFLNEFKLRGSYGSVGNQNVGGSLYPTYVEMSGWTNIWPLGNTETSGYAQSILPNMNIQWERTYMTNIGADVKMFSNRFSINADVYWRKTNDIIRNPVLPAVVGLGQASVNMGVVKSKGWELSLGWDDTKGDWSYSFKFDLANASNKVKSLGGTNPLLLDAMVKEGEEMNALYGYRVDRIAQESDFTYNPATGKRTPKFAYPDGWNEAGLVNPGDLIYKDLDGSGSITPDDREVIGSMQPRYTYSFNASVTWKNFDFAIFLQGVGKVDGYIYSEAMHPFITDYAQPQKVHLDRWTPTNPNASYPRLTEGKDYNSGLFSDYWLQDASYLRIKNIAIGYTLPTKFTKSIGISKCRVYASAENPFTFTDYFYAYDPETILNNGSFYPQLRTFYFGVNLTF